MPFRKTGPNEYTCPKGQKKTRAQVNSARNRRGSKNPMSRMNRNRRRAK